MSDPDMMTAIKSLIATTCDIDVAGIEDDGRLDSYGLDSVRTIDLVIAIEDDLGVAISENDPELAKVRTVRELAVLVASRT